MPNITPPLLSRSGSTDPAYPAALVLVVDLQGGILGADERLCRLMEQPVGSARTLEVLLPDETARLVRDFIAGGAQSEIVQHSLAVPGRPAIPAMIGMARQAAQIELRIALLAELSDAYAAEMIAQAEILSAMLGTAPEAFWCIEYQEPIDLDLTEDSVIDQFFRNARCWRACNPAMARLYQLPHGVDFHDQPVSRYFPETPVNRAMVRDLVRADYALDGAVAIDHRHDGSEILVVNSFRAKVENGYLLRMWGTVRDISLERAREDNLASQASEMVGILTALPDPVIVVGQDDGILAVNPAAERMLGAGLQRGWSLEAAGFPAETVRRLREMAVLGQGDGVELQLPCPQSEGGVWLLHSALTEGAEGWLVISAWRQPGHAKPLRRAGGAR
ncbi:MAG: PAS domain-containing protein [Rhodobacteraceae bacterium]|jgi:PAS domain-containing protein|nr:PAS domain-containing protein [Paracoccaceae bacterium]